MKNLVLLAILCFEQTLATGNAPSNVKAVSVTANSAILVWDAATNENVTEYVVRPCSTPASKLCISNFRSTYCNISTSNTCCCYYVESYVNNVYVPLDQSANVYISTLPFPPRISSITATYRTTTVTVSWTACHGAHRYYVGYRSWRSMSLPWTIMETPSTSITISKLIPLNTYQFRVQCENTIGRSSFSLSLNHTVQVTRPPTISNVSTESTVATVYWEPPQGSDGLTWYTFLVSSDGHQRTTRVWNLSRRFTASNLFPETVYVFQVREVRSSDENGPWSKPKVGITLPIIPEMVLGFSDNETTESSISVSWMKPPSTVDLYRLTIHSDDTADEVSLVNSTERYTFHDLSPLTDYHITIWAINKAGSGPFSAVNVTTLSDTQTRLTTSFIALAAVVGMLMSILATIVIVFIIVVCVKCLCRTGNPTNSFNVAMSRHDNLPLTENVSYDVASNHNHCSEVCIEENDGGIFKGNVYETDYVIDTKSFFDDLTLPPRVPERKYIGEKLTKPTQFTTMPVWCDFMTFQKESGWFNPTSAIVMCEKLNCSERYFNALGPGIFYMFHKSKKKAKYIDYAVDLSQTLCGIVNNLYKKERCDLNPLEVELKHFSPSAEQWCVKVWQCDKKDLLLERAKGIIQYQTLKPHGLNQRLKITSKEMWVGFSEWYVGCKK